MRGGRSLLWLAAGCASSDPSSASDAASPGGSDSATSPDPEDPSNPPTDSGSWIDAAAYHAIDLDFRISGTTLEAPGTWQTDTSVLEVRLWSRAHTVVCSLQVPVLSVAPAPLPDLDPAPLAWWQVELDAGVPRSGDGCPGWPARSWSLGVGPYDPQLDPMLAARGMLGFDVYALYLQEGPEAPIYLVGYAGTLPMVQGELGLAVDVPPPPRRTVRRRVAGPDVARLRRRRG